MFKPRIKFEMSTITCNEEMIATPNVKILVLSHPLGDSIRGITHRVHLWLDDGKRIVYFLLVIIELFSLTAVMAEARNLSKSAFSEWVGQFERKFLANVNVLRYVC